MTMSVPMPGLGTAAPPPNTPIVRVPFNPMVQDGNGLIYYCGPGGCDPLQRNSPFGPLCHRHSPFWLQFNPQARLDAPGTFDLVLLGGTELQVFSAGPGQSGVSMGIPATAGPVTVCDATTFDNGDVADVNEVFVASAMSVEVDRPFRLLAPPTADVPIAPGDNLSYDPDLDDIVRRALHAVMTQVCLDTSFGRNACNYNLDLIKYWPQYSGPSHDGETPINGTPIARLTVPFCFPLCLSSSLSPNKLTIRAHVGRTIRLRSSAACPITTNAPVYVPVQVDLIGSVICFPNYYIAGNMVLPNGLAYPPSPAAVPVPG